MQELLSPSVWYRFSQRLERANSVLLALDFDGTLAPIAEHPDKASAPSRTLDLLSALAGKPGCKIAIVTGRTLADVKQRVRVVGVIYCGNHGLQMEVDGRRWTAPSAARERASIREAEKALSTALRSLPGIVLESKGLSLSVHYRQASTEDKGRCLRLCGKVLQPFLASGRLKVDQGKEVMEVQPDVPWDKGACLKRLARLTFVKAGEAGLCIFIGDDVFDEPAFRAIRQMDGVGILVGGRDPESSATCFLPSTRAVQKFLARLLDIPSNL